MTPREGCIALNLISGIGYAKYTALTERFGSPERVFSASPEELLEVPGVGPLLAGRIAGFDPAGLAEELAAVARGGVRLFTLLYPVFPAALR